MPSYRLRELEADLHKTVTVTTEEKGSDGLYIFRSADGEAFMWGPTPTRYEYHDVQTVQEADSVMFLCPKCFEKNHGSIGTHSVLVTFAGRNVPDEASSRGNDGKPTRWNASGNTIDDLVLTPSILLDSSRKPEEGCHWHGFVGSNGIAPGHAG